jgi:hypothetical protein
LGITSLISERFPVRQLCSQGITHGSILVLAIQFQYRSCVFLF